LPVDDEKQFRYRNMFWLRDHSRRAFQAQGVFGQFIHVDMESELVVVKLSSWPEFLSAERKLCAFAAVDAITAAASEWRQQL